MENKELKERLTILFATHPKEDMFYFTSDGQAFTKENKHYAEAHAGGLPDKEIQPYSRVVFEKIEELQEKVLASKATQEATGDTTQDTSTITDTSQNSDTTETPAADGKADTAKDEDQPLNDANASGNDTASNTTEITPDEKAVLVVRYNELFGKKPHHMLSIENLKKAIAEKEAEASK